MILILITQKHEFAICMTRIANSFKENDKIIELFIAKDTFYHYL